MYSLIVRQEIRNHCCIHRFQVRSCLKKFLTTVTRPCGKNSSPKQQRTFSWSRVKNSREGKLEISKDAKPQVKQVPKLSELRKLMQVAKPEKWKIAGAVCFLAISSTVTLSVPFCMGKVIDIINTSAHDGTLTEKLTTFSSVLLVIFLVGGLANFARSYLMDISAQNVMLRIRSNLYSSILKQEIGFFDKNKTGELISRLSTDAALVGRSVTFNISDGLRASAQAVGSIGMMIYVSPKLTGIALIIVPSIAALSIVYGRFLRKITREYQDSLAKATSLAEERISNIRTVRSFTKEKLETERYNKSLHVLLTLAKKQALATAVYWGSTGFSGNMIILSVFYAGGLMMNDSLITIGELSAFLLYAAYIGVAMGGMSSFYSELNKGLGASAKIWELTDRVPRIPMTEGLMLPATAIKGQVEFRDVTFSYPTRAESKILSGLNLSMPAGTVTALVGASGSGKSTIGCLLMRFYDPNQGGVFLDEENIRNLNAEWLRDQMGVVSQEPTLFSCSIADNIRYGASNPETVTMEEVEYAAREAFADRFINNFPQKYDTLVGERGLMLSGGQKQRIALARAIVKNPRLLLLDEATSALDSESEHYVKEALSRLMVGRTVITIAHRLSTIKTADQIAVLDDGRVAELGTYAELTAIPDGIFRKLVEKQTITS